LRRGTAAQWTASNPVLAEGEVGLETDTRKFKVGDGLTAWSSLSYWQTGGGGATALDDLSDVIISGAASGEYLRYNGTNWVDATIQASDLPTGIDAAKIANGNVSNTEFQYLDGVTSAIQTQLNGKATEGTAVAFTSVNINGTAGNGHIHFKHQSGDPSVSANNTAIWADNAGDLYAKNDGNAKSKVLTAAEIGTTVQAYSSVLANTTASFTTADETKLDGIEAGADVTDAGNVGSAIHGATGKTTPVDADTVPLIDSAASNVLKKVTWANVKATLKSYFDTLYQAAGSYLTSANITQTITNGVTDKAPSEDAVFDALALKGSSTFIDCIGGIIETPADGDYMLVVKMPYAGTINETVTKSASGTCTATFKVNTTALGGTANSVSSAEQSQTHSSSNTFAAGDDIQVTISSNSACSKMSFSIKVTRSI
jgi:hypothetical protein